VRLKETGDVEAAHQLVTANLRLVVKISLEYQKVYLNVMDLIQEGTIGLMQAVKKFDPYRGVKLSTYAAWWIKAYIMKYILNNIRMVKMGTGQRQKHLFYNLQKERERLENLGFTATPSLMAASLDSTEKEVSEMSQRMGRREISLDVPAYEGSTKTVGDMVASTLAAPEDTLAEEQEGRIYGERLAEFSKGLSGKEKVIFEERLIAEDPITLQELGKRFGVSRERVRQLEVRLLRRLKESVGDLEKKRGPAQ
jgi:RNA polymerase sigma-32 factor